MPRFLKKLSDRTSPPAPEVTLVPVEGLPSVRRPYGSGNTVAGVQGRVATPGGVYAQVMSSRLDRFEEEEGLEHESGDEELVMEVDHEMGGSDVNEEAVRRAGKKQRQWRNWSEQVIPMLLEPYLELLRESEGLRNLMSVRDRLGCRGCMHGRNLEVLCVYFESLCCISFLG